MAKRKLTGRQVRYLFATGKLRSVGSGKNREVEYNKNAPSLKPPYRAKERIRNAAGKVVGRQAAGTSTYRRKIGTSRRRGAEPQNTPNKIARVVIGGSKSAGLRSGAGEKNGGRRYPASERANVIAQQRKEAVKAVMGAGIRDARHGTGGRSTALAEQARDVQAYIKNQRARGGKVDAFEVIRDTYGNQKENILRGRYAGLRGDRDLPRHLNYIDRSTERIPKIPKRGASSGGGSGRKVPSKAERDATRADRIAAGVRKAEQAIGSGSGSSSGALARMLLKENPSRTGARSLRAEVRQESIRAGVERLAADRGATPGEVARAIARAPRGKRREHFLKIQQKGVDGVDAGQRVKLFSSFGKTRPKLPKLPKL